MVCEMLLITGTILSICIYSVNGQFGQCLDDESQCDKCYDANGNWLGNDWTQWTACSSKCKGTQQRERYLVATFFCCGCPTFADPEVATRACDGLNNCEQLCNEGDGSCSCNGGYTLNSDSRSCSKRSCADISTQIPSCPSGVSDAFGSKCEQPQTSCTDNNKLDSTCTFTCSQNYKVAKIPQDKPFEFLDSATFLNENNNVNCIFDSVMKWSQETQEIYCRRQNDPPKNILLSAVELNENANSGTVIGIVTAIDDTGTLITFSLESNDFEITQINGAYQLVNKKLISLENGNNLPMSITIRATDDGTPQMYFDKTFSILIINVNDPPEDIQLSSNVIPNTAEVDRIVGVFSAIDKDMANPQHSTSAFTWSLTNNGGDKFKVVDGSLQIANKFPEDYSGLVTIEVKCTDKDPDDPKFITKTFSINVTDDNDGPHNLELDFSSLPEDTAVNSTVGQIEAKDKEADEIQFTTSSEYFSITSPSTCENDDSEFECKADIVLSKKLNYEDENNRVIEFAITATDTNNKQTNNVFTIVVTNVNEPITNIELVSVNSVPRNALPNQYVGLVRITDEDFTNDHTCEVVSPSDLFTIPQNSLNVVVKTQLDNQTPSYTLRIKCDDPAGGMTKDFQYQTANSCTGRACTRDLTLCNNVLCRTNDHEVCSAHIMSTKRCIPIGNQMRMLLKVPPAKSSDFDYLYDLEEYVEKVLKNQANGLSLSNMKGASNNARRRRDVTSNIELEAIEIQVAQLNSYLYVALIPRHDSTYALQDAIAVCTELENRKADVHCLSQAGCTILQEAGYPCPPLYSNTNFGQSSATKAPEDDDGSSNSWLIGVIIGVFLLLVIIVIIIFYVRRRKKHEKLYDGGIVFNNSTSRIALRTPDNQFNASNNYSVPFEDKSYVTDVKKRNDIKVVNNDIYKTDEKDDSMTFEVTNPAYGLSATNHAFDASDENGLEVPKPHSPLYASVGKASGKSYDRIDIEDVNSAKTKEIEDSPPTTPTASYDRLSTIDRHISVNQYNPEIDDREKVVKQSFSES